MPEVLYRDPFNAVLLNSPSLQVTAEQNQYIKDVLMIGASDSKFAEKMYHALAIILTAGSVAPPVVGSLDPTTVELGQPSFTLRVIGTGFTPFSTIVFNGYDELTVFVSDTELTTGVNMPLWQAPVVVPVKVKTGSVVSDPVDFSFTEAAAPLSTLTDDSYSKKSVKEEQLKLPFENSLKEEKHRDDSDKLKETLAKLKKDK